MSTRWSFRVLDEEGNEIAAGYGTGQTAYGSIKTAQNQMQTKLLGLIKGLVAWDRIEIKVGREPRVTQGQTHDERT